MTSPNDPTNTGNTRPSTSSAATNISDKASTKKHSHSFIVSNRILRKVIIWFAFSVIVGSFPIIFNILVLFTNNKPISFFDLFAHGELLLISVAIAADAIGDMIYSKRFDRFADIICICWCFLMVLISIGWFSSLGIGGKATNTSGFGFASLLIFITTILASSNCKAQVEVQHVD